MYVAPHRSLHQWTPGISGRPARFAKSIPLLAPITFPISYTPLGLEVPRSSDIRQFSRPSVCSVCEESHRVVPHSSSIRAMGEIDYSRTMWGNLKRRWFAGAS